MQIGISLPVGHGLSPRELVELSVRADKAGLDSVAIGELNGTDAIGLAGAIAEATDRIRVETSVLAIWSRSPALMAMAAATLADISEGRFVLGIGSGSPMVASFHGTTFEAPLAHVRQSVAAIRTALSGESISDAGNFRLRGTPLRSTPLFLSAMNERMASLAGEVADGIVLNFCGPEGVRHLGGLAMTARLEAPQRPRLPFETHTAVWLYAGDDVEGARLTFRREMAPYLAVPTYERAAAALSAPDQVAHAAEVWRSAGRDAAAAVFPDSITDALLHTGAPNRIAAKVAEFAAAGCVGVRFTPIADDSGDLTQITESVTLLGEVASQLRN